MRNRLQDSILSPLFSAYLDVILSCYLGSFRLTHFQPGIKKNPIRQKSIEINMQMDFYLEASF